MRSACVLTNSCAWFDGILYPHENLLQEDTGAHPTIQASWHAQCGRGKRLVIGEATVRSELILPHFLGFLRCEDASDTVQNFKFYLCFCIVIDSSVYACNVCLVTLRRSSRTPGSLGCDGSMCGTPSVVMSPALIHLLPVDGFRGIV